MQKSLACFFVLLFCGLQFNTLAQVPALIKDINNPLVNGNPRGMSRVGNTVFFAATDAVHGTELWKTNGTEAGTQMVKDINQIGHSNPSNFVNLNGTVFFLTTNNFVQGVELWKSDGTAAGTQFVANLVLGGNDPSFAQLTACNDRVFYRGFQSVIPPAGPPFLELKLFVTDGTTAGTKVLGNTLNQPRNLTAVGNRLFLSGQSPSSPGGNQLLRTDGNTVVVVKPFDFQGQTESQLPANFVNVNGTLFFSAQNSATNGQQIWKSDGTANGTTPRTNSPFGFTVREMNHVNGTVFFAGSEATPVQLSTAPFLLRLNGLNNITEFPTAGVDNLTPFDGRMVFTQIAQLGSTLSRATVAGAAITNLQSFPVSGSPSQLTVAGTTLFFEAGTEATGLELWKSNAAGTAMVQDFVSGAANANISSICALNSEVIFASYGIGSTIGGNELRKSNGTPNAIVTLLNIGRAGSFPKEFVKMGNLTFFTADDADAGREVWKTDGSFAGTQRVADLIVGTTGSEPGQLTVVTTPGGVQTLFFVAKSPNNGRELFKLENLAGAVPTRISDIIVGAGNSGIEQLTSVNGVLHFTANTNLAGFNQIFKVNAARTAVQSASGNLQSASNLKAMGSTLFFTQSPQNGGPQLWKLGAAAPIKTFATSAGQEYPIPQQLTVVGSRLFFSAPDGIQGRRLWVTNTNATAVSQVSSLNPAELTNFNGRLVFHAPSGNIIGQRSIFRVNVAFTGVETLAIGSSIDGLEAAGSNLYFFQAFQQGLVELSKITVNNNAIVSLKTFPQGNSGVAVQMVAAGNNLFFNMNEATTGNELWKSNGTALGTVLVSDIRPGVGHSNLQSMALCGSDLFFSADNLTHGQEPWRLTNATAAQGDDEGGERSAAAEAQVEEIEAVAAEIRVYPNPAIDFINVDLPENGLTGTLSILSASGQMVRSVQSSEGDTSVRLDVQDLPKGMYLVRWVQSDEQVVVRKVMVQ